MDERRSCLSRHWIHSHEEDSAGLRVYRPAQFAFPPSRGRVGFDLRPDGTLTWFGIAAADGSSAAEGHWRLISPDAVEITVANGADAPVSLEIESCGADKLVVRA